jgi:hypothetical protein
MAFRLPGPLGGLAAATVIDEGTMCRAASPVPGPAVRTRTTMAALPRRPISMRTSPAGLAFIFSIEVGPLEEVTARLHWPGGSSGVTLGPGFDMKDRSAKDIAQVLARVGVPAPAAEAAAEGAGLHGAQASAFAEEYQDLVVLGRQQQLALLREIVPHYEAIVRRNVRVELQQHEFDALVCFVYNPGGSFLPVARCINRHELVQAAEIMRARVLTGGRKSKGLAARRRRETRLLLEGLY